MVGELGEDGKVVGDYHERGPLGRLEALEEPHDLRLHEHVEGGRRLVGDDQVGPEQEGERDHDALLHPAAQLVRVPRQDVLVQADRLDCLGHDAVRIAAPAAGPVHRERLCELLAHGIDGVERAHRPLEHHRYALPPPLRVELGVGRAEDGVAAERDRAGRHGPAAQRPHDGEAERALAARARAGHADALAPLGAQRGAL